MSIFQLPGSQQLLWPSAFGARPKALCIELASVPAGSFVEY